MKKRYIVILIFCWGFFIFLLQLFCGCNHAPPVIEPTPPILEKCMIITPKYGTGWIDAGDINGDQLPDIVIWHWHDINPALSGYQKAVEVWENKGVGVPPSLLFSYTWTDPYYPYISYPNYKVEQGPGMVANVIGGDNGRCELVFVSYEVDSYYLCVYKFHEDNKNLVLYRKTAIFSDVGSHISPVDVIACSVSRPHSRTYSNIVVGYRHWNKYAHGAVCYYANSLEIYKSRWFTVDNTPYGYFNPDHRWVCHRMYPFLWTNDRHCLWTGYTILDWEFGGDLGDSSFEDYPIEITDMLGNDDYFQNHWDSIAVFHRGSRPPALLLTEDGPLVWYSDSLYAFERSDGNKYWQYRIVGTIRKKHPHRTRVIRMSPPLAIFTDVDHDDTTKDKVYAINPISMSIEWFRWTLQEAEVIEWDGDHTTWEILTEEGIYDYKGRKITDSYTWRGILENNFRFDLFPTLYPGHQQYAFSRIKDGKEQIVFVGNPDAKKNNRVEIDPNHNFY